MHNVSRTERAPSWSSGSGTVWLAARHFVLTRRRWTMGFGRGALLWLLGVPLPIIILLALFWHH